MTPDLNTVTVATFVYLAHRAGHALPAALADLCATIDREGATADLGERLVAVLHPQLGDGSPEATLAGLRSIFGENLRTDLGGGSSREERTAALRRARFGRSTPWLAWLLERQDGALRPTLMLVEGFGETVQVMDPNPFNDIDEARTYEVVEFMTRWELAGEKAASL